MNFEQDFKNHYNRIFYKKIDKLYYNKYPFKIEGIRHWVNLSSMLFHYQKSKEKYLSWEDCMPKNEYKHIFSTDHQIMVFLNTLKYGMYYTSATEVNKFLDIIKLCRDTIKDISLHYPINILGPEDINHLESLKQLKSKKKTEISGLNLKEVLKKPTYEGFRYKLQGVYKYDSGLTSLKDFINETNSFVELFGGIANENVKFTGYVKSVIDECYNIEKIYHNTKRYGGNMSFTIHYKDHSELLSLNFMKKNVFISSAVEFVK